MPKVEVDLEKCIGCATCFNVCPSNVFIIRKGKSYPVNAENCVMCRACIVHCPVDAIRIAHREQKSAISRLYGEA